MGLSSIWSLPEAPGRFIPQLENRMHQDNYNHATGKSDDREEMTARLRERVIPGLN